MTINLTSAASRKATVWQPATIVDIVARSSRVKSYLLKPEKPFAYQAGQHATVRLTAEDGYRAQRNYSIATAPEDGDIIELAIEKLDEVRTELLTDTPLPKLPRMPRPRALLTGIVVGSDNPCHPKAM